MLNAETPAREDLIRRINHTLNKIRPYLQADGGDVEFVDFQDGVVTVTMTGACAGCLMASSDISEGVQAILIDEVEEVRSVKLLESTPFGYENINF
ncbi:MAG: NifU family protein [Erysipelotrichaceae bacterium]|jgi:Fe-S cluster biogenesis protein NfuA|nr:NifU family protein [Erysipelotrichaceae bacterium 7770_A6]MDD7057994.1 NifU family protein [Erysipelotrichaceae bacterium]